MTVDELTNAVDTLRTRVELIISILESVGARGIADRRLSLYVDGPRVVNLIRDRLATEDKVVLLEDGAGLAGLQATLFISDSDLMVRSYVPTAKKYELGILYQFKSGVLSYMNTNFRLRLEKNTLAIKTCLLSCEEKIQTFGPSDQNNCFSNSDYSWCQLPVSYNLDEAKESYRLGYNPEICLVALYDENWHLAAEACDKVLMPEAKHLEPYGPGSFGYFSTEDQVLQVSCYDPEDNQSLDVEANKNYLITIARGCAVETGKFRFRHTNYIAAGHEVIDLAYLNYRDEVWEDIEEVAGYIAEFRDEMWARASDRNLSRLTVVSELRLKMTKYMEDLPGKVRRIEKLEKESSLTYFNTGMSLLLLLFNARAIYHQLRATFGFFRDLCFQDGEEKRSKRKSKRDKKTNASPSYPPLEDGYPTEDVHPSAPLGRAHSNDTLVGEEYQESEGVPLPAYGDSVI